jgi:hypothetical protein
VAAKKPAVIGDWECRDATRDVVGTQIYVDVTANQAKAAFGREYGCDYTDVRVRKA